MGLGFRISSGNENYSIWERAKALVTPPKKDGNPNPYRFNIERTQTFEHNDAIVAEITYPDCTNFEGKKILVFKNAKDFYKCVKVSKLDPHFIENTTSPIARFEPTNKGWEYAVNFAKSL